MNTNLALIRINSVARYRPHLRQGVACDNRGNVYPCFFLDGEYGRPYLSSDVLLGQLSVDYEDGFEIMGDSGMIHYRAFGNCSLAVRDEDGFLETESDEDGSRDETWSVNCMTLDMRLPGGPLAGEIRLFLFTPDCIQLKIHYLQDGEWTELVEYTV